MKYISFREKFKNYYFIFVGFIPSFFLCFFSLNFLMKITGSVKGKYINYYKSVFKDLRFKKLNILEIGIGGHDLEYYKGGSLLMWKHYFLFSNIYGLDIIKKNFNLFPRINNFVGSQVSEMTLNNICNTVKKVDVVIDDGSHYLEHIYFTFKFLFKHLSNNGIYVIEDIKMPYLKSVPDIPLEKISDPCLFFNTLIHRINSSNFGEIHEDYYLNNISNIICNDTQIIIFKKKRDKQDFYNKFPIDKNNEGFIPIYNKINKNK